MSIRTTALAAVATVVAMSGAAGPASAHHPSHGFYPRPHLYFYAGPPERDCSFYREMWEETGLFSWKRRYFVCKGWW